LTSSGTVCLTFDFDAVSLWISRNMLTPTPVSRGEFGAAAVPRLLDLLSERNILSTWFIPGHTVETYPEVCREVVAAGHEVGLHGYAHENVGTLDERQEREMFHRIYGLVGDLAGVPPKGNRAPAWDLTPHTVDIMLELSLVYDSSLMGNDFSPYYVRRGDKIPRDAPLSFGEETSLVELPVSWSLDDYPHLEYLRLPHAVMPGLKMPEDMFRNWTDDIRYMLRDFTDGVLVVTFHPQVIGRGHRMLGFERWLDELISMDVAFERLDGVAERYLEGRSYGGYSPRQGGRRR
jgi:peptidoglycan/xylan/chitin deacetylase (PgdA/CDA1 family)